MPENIDDAAQPAGGTGDSAPDTISHDTGYDVLPAAGTSAASRGTRVTALATVAALVVVGGAVALAWQAFSSKSHSAEQLIPGNAFAVAVGDASLPHGQDHALKAFADVFPDSPTHHGSGSALDRLLRAAFRHSSDPHVDYDRDIKPWVGDHVAIAGWVDASGKPQAEGLIEVRDQAAARRTLSKSLDGKGSDGTFIFSGGYAVIADTTALAHAAVEAAHKSSLADNSTYNDDVAQLPGDPAVVAWMDGPSTSRAIRGAMGAEAGRMMSTIGPLGFGPFGGVNQLLKGRFAAGLVVGDRYAELDLRGVGQQPAKTTASNRLTGLPAGTIAGLEISNPGAIVRQVMPLARMFGTGVTTACSAGAATPVFAVPPGTTLSKEQQRRLAQARRQMRAQCRTVQPPNPFALIKRYTGLTLPGDATTLFGDSLVASYGGLSLQGMPKVALRTHPSDPAAALAIARRLRATLARSVGFPLAVDSAGGDVVLATTQDYVQALTSGAGLGSQAQAKLALGDLPANVTGAGYVDLSRILGLIPGVPQDLTHLRAVGFWSDAQGTVVHSQLRVVVG